MPRYVIVIRKPDHPTAYYLSRNGFRCYDHRNVGIIHSLADAQKELAYFVPLMREFRLTISRLPARLCLAKALLSAVPVE